MEDILEVYKRPYDPLHPLVCLDESSHQHIIEVANPIPMEPGQAERYDTEYERNGVSSLFMMFEPLSGWRHVKDNLNTHSPTSLYKAFSPEEARRIADKLEFHSTLWAGEKTKRRSAGQ
ncbi:hypothetical protein [Sansalvadorimonas verongulae]|uniref:hypothetical protein n=1 Tax=Sansalvadorimonas verongulae TaxID=2172824 RepID=UPI0012BD3BFE|nr:hypothetical protein [Sansalvadorimonas verongulae]MTI14085.1 hypothetical protein [Sansalvadorimonas verongulae]